MGGSVRLVQMQGDSTKATCVHGGGKGAGAAGLPGALVQGQGQSPKVTRMHSSTDPGWQAH